MDKGTKGPVFFRSDVKGRITKRKMGKLKSFTWSELSLVFKPEGKTKTLAQMPEDEYYSWIKDSDSDKYYRDFAKFFLKRTAY
jgi:inosine/xanthosine triphosphate pyrophosphatase family protein